MWRRPFEADTASVHHVDLHIAVARVIEEKLVVEKLRGRSPRESVIQRLCRTRGRTAMTTGVMWGMPKVSGERAETRTDGQACQVNFL